MGSVQAAYNHAPCGWLEICTGVRRGHEMIGGDQADSTEDFLGVTIDVPVTEPEMGAKCMSFVHGEWVRKWDTFAQAMLVGVNIYFIVILCYISIVAPHISFAFSVVDFVGDWVKPLHPANYCLLREFLLSPLGIGHD